MKAEDDGEEEDELSGGSLNKSNRFPPRPKLTSMNLSPSDPLLGSVANSWGSITRSPLLVDDRVENVRNHR